MPLIDRAFDLSSEAARTRAHNTGVRATLFSVGGVLFAIGLLVSLYGPDGAQANWIPALILWIAAALAIWIALKPRSPVLTSVSVSSSSVVLRFSTGPGQEQEWADPRFGLTIYEDLFDVTHPGGAYPTPWLSAASARGGQVSEEVVQSITSHAREAGVPLLTQREQVGTGKAARPLMVTRIGSLSSTPGWSVSPSIRAASARLR